MKELLAEHKKYQYKELTSKQQLKLSGLDYPGCRIEITWVGREEHDYGYLFQLPICDDGIGDFLFHVPNPDNSDGRDNAPPVWGHLNNLLSNKRVKSVKCS